MFTLTNTNLIGNIFNNLGINHITCKNHPIIMLLRDITLYICKYRFRIIYYTSRTSELSRLKWLKFQNVGISVN